MKKLFSVSLVLLLILLFLPFCPQAAETENQGCILRTRIDYFEDRQGVSVQMRTAAGEKVVYSLSDQVTVDGTSYSCAREAASLYSLFEKIRFVTYTLTDGGKISSITSALLVETYYDVKYVPEESTFYYFDADLADEEMTDDDEDDTRFWFPVKGASHLPTFAYEGEYTAFVDENHYYEIELYNTCVHVTDMYAVHEDYYALPFLTTESSIGYHFKQAITLSNETSFSDKLNVQLYDAENCLVQEMTNSYISFSNLENKTADYTLKIYGVDRNNVQCTPLYTLYHQTKYTPVFEGMVIGTSFSNSISGPELHIHIRDTAGNEHDFMMSSYPYHIAGRSYRDKELAKEAAESLMHVFYAIENGYLDVIEPVPHTRKTEAYSVSIYPQKSDSLLEISFTEYPLGYEDITAIVAVYGENGELLSWSPETFFPTSTEYMHSCTISIPENYKICKVFLWDTLSGLSPFNGKKIN